MWRIRGDWMDKYCGSIMLDVSRTPWQYIVNYVDERIGIKSDNYRMHGPPAGTIETAIDSAMKHQEELREKKKREENVLQPHSTRVFGNTEIVNHSSRSVRISGTAVPSGWVLRVEDV